MEIYDVIIVGGGPAGLMCAHRLVQSDLSVLLLEKESRFGDKLCAGGLTLKDMRILPLPDQVIEHKVTRAILYSRKRSAGTETPYPFLFTVDRKELGAYQRSLLEDTSVKVLTNSQVTDVEQNRVLLKDGHAFGFRYLVGAEGYNSVVRRHLGLTVRNKLMGFQYTIPSAQIELVMSIFMDARWFDAWYAWIFPHRESVAVGCCCDPDRVNHQKVKAGFHKWLRERDIDPGDTKLESHPISYDYRGIHFGNKYLIGEAAGLASGFTGEGIYQSLVSGHEVAKLILDPAYGLPLLREVLQYNRVLERIMNTLRCTGPLKGSIQELLLRLMNQEWLRDKINAQFT